MSRRLGLTEGLVRRERVEIDPARVHGALSAVGVSVPTLVNTLLLCYLYKLELVWWSRKYNSNALERESSTQDMTP